MLFVLLIACKRMCVAGEWLRVGNKRLSQSTCVEYPPLDKALSVQCSVGNEQSVVPSLALFSPNLPVIREKHCRKLLHTSSAAAKGSGSEKDECPPAAEQTIPADQSDCFPTPSLAFPQSPESGQDSEGQFRSFFWS